MAPPIDGFVRELGIALYGKDGNTWERGRLEAVRSVLLRVVAFGAQSAHERAEAKQSEPPLGPALRALVDKLKGYREHSEAEAKRSHPKGHYYTGRVAEAKTLNVCISELEALLGRLDPPPPEEERK